MTRYSKFNIIYLLQKWMDSVPGQTFLNYAYSWGASIVILGTLFKLTHLEGANLMLFIGMGTEVVVFFLSAFDRPFDKTADGMDLSTHYGVENQQNVEGELEAQGVEGATDENVDALGGEGQEGGQMAAAYGGGTIIIGGGIANAFALYEAPMRQQLSTFPYPENVAATRIQPSTLPNAAMLGAAAMSLSSFCVVTNALRLNLFQMHVPGRREREHAKTEMTAVNMQQENKNESEDKKMTKTMKIEGMMCGHCEARVKKALEALPEVEEAVVSHESGTAEVKLQAEIADEVLKKAVEDQDYEVTSIE